ncbi:hypothetical protein GcM3_013051 [Golovinomyces cichoracearum]|uniref:Uncharacterized protein n=1 Tax=Golovinomyces cichoracearum TaxID=62708 RepID=A0A420J9L0_9PEZI|nr:hypothetical protein GcM3_013051 [Golovinomyces cichoracearum]
MKLAIIVTAQLVSIVTANLATFSSCEKVHCMPLVLSGNTIYNNVHECRRCYAVNRAAPGRSTNNKFYTHCVEVLKVTSSGTEDTVKKENAIQDVMMCADQDSAYSGSISHKKESTQEKGEINRDKWVIETGADIDAVDKRNDLRQEYLVRTGIKQLTIQTGNGKVDAESVGEMGL